MLVRESFVLVDEAKLDFAGVATEAMVATERRCGLLGYRNPKVVMLEKRYHPTKEVPEYSVYFEAEVNDGKV